MTIELDGWYLPDTAATSYRNGHVKTGVIAEAIDLADERFRYYHNASLYELAGDDFRGAFRTEPGWSRDVLPPYTELIRFDAGPRLERRGAARGRALGLLRGHLDRVPPGNPFDRFARAARRRPAVAPRGRRGPLPRLHVRDVPDGRRRVRAPRLARRLAARTSAAPRRPPAMARIVEGCKVLGLQAGPAPAVRPDRGDEGLGEAWTEAIDALDDAVA